MSAIFRVYYCKRKFCLLCFDHLEEMFSVDQRNDMHSESVLLNNKPLGGECFSYVLNLTKKKILVILFPTVQYWIHKEQIIFSYQPSKLYWLESNNLDILQVTWKKSSSIHITYQFSRTGMLTMECKVLQQLHNFIRGSLYIYVYICIYHTDYHCALADQVSLRRASSGQYCPSHTVRPVGAKCPSSYPGRAE